MKVKVVVYFHSFFMDMFFSESFCIICGSKERERERDHENIIMSLMPNIIIIIQVPFFSDQTTCISNI